MKISARVTGAKQFGKALARHAKTMEKEALAILRQEARALAVAYGSATTPPDAAGPDAAEKFKDRIEKEVSRVYVTRDSPRAVYALMKKHAPDLAKAYWNAHKSQKPRQMTAILRKAGLPQGGASADGLKKYRTGKGARVVTGQGGGESLVRTSEQRRLIREQQATVGTAKAGWHQAARGIGGRVRRNFVSATGKRTTAEVFPAYVRKVSRKLANLGGAFVGTGSVTIWTNVHHATKALADSKRRGAEINARNNLQKAMTIAVERANLKAFGKVS